MKNDVSLTNLETQITSFLQEKSETDDVVRLEELMQFSKPGAKLKTVQKNYTDLLRKYKLAGFQAPWKCKIVYPSQVKSDVDKSSVEEQKIVHVKTTVGGNIKIVSDSVPSIQIDYKLDNCTKSVTSKRDGKIILDNFEDWYVIKHLWENCGRRIYLEELKDVLWHNAGSKTPARWMVSIQRRICNLRRAIPSLKDRLLTVITKDGTFYLFE